MEKPKKGLVVDGSTRGNPGPSKYKIFDLETDKVIFESDWIGVTTNNITEFLALCHGIHIVNKMGLNIPVYSDSQTAISWVNKKVVSSTSNSLSDRINKAVDYLKNSNTPVIEKWHTSMWGENPADFGNK